MTEKLKQKAEDFIKKSKATNLIRRTREREYRTVSDYSDKELETIYKTEIGLMIGFATEVTKELQEENRQLKNDYEMIHNCFLISENEKKELEKQNKELKCCQNCKHRNEVKSYKALGGKEISKVCSDGNYTCENWEFAE